MCTSFSYSGGSGFPALIVYSPTGSPYPVTAGTFTSVSSTAQSMQYMVSIPVTGIVLYFQGHLNLQVNAESASAQAKIMG